MLTVEQLTAQIGEADLMPMTFSIAPLKDFLINILQLLRTQTDKISNLEQKTDEAVAEAAKVGNLSNAFGELSSKLDSGISDLKDQVAAVKNDTEANKSMVENLNNDVSSNKENLNTLASQSEEIKQLKDQLAENAKLIQSLEGKLQDSATVARTLRNRVGEQANRVNELDEEVQRLKELNEGSGMGQSSTLTSVPVNAEEKIRTFEKDVTTMHMKLPRMENDIKSIKEDLARLLQNGSAVKSRSLGPSGSQGSEDMATKGTVQPPTDNNKLRPRNYSRQTTPLNESNPDLQEPSDTEQDISQNDTQETNEEDGNEVEENTLEEEETVQEGGNPNEDITRINSELDELKREIAERPDRATIERLFEKFRESLNELKASTMENPQDMGNYATTDDIIRLEEMIRSYTSGLGDAAAVRKSAKCLCCGQSYRTVTGSIMDNETKSILGAAPISHVTGKSQSIVYGTDHELYYSSIPSNHPIALPTLRTPRTPR